jgi:hypothetical protein
MEDPQAREDRENRDPEINNLRAYVSRAADLNDAAHYSGGWAPFKHAAGYIAQRAAPIAMGALAGGGGIPTGVALGAMIPGAAKSLYDALPLPSNQNTPIRQAGAVERQNFYNDVDRGRYVSAGADFLRANGLTLGQFIKDLVPPVPGAKP